MHLNVLGKNATLRRNVVIDLCEQQNGPGGFEIKTEIIISKNTVMGDFICS